MKKSLKRKQGGASFVEMPAQRQRSGVAVDDGQAGGDVEMLVVTICSLGADGTFEVTVRADALVDDLLDAIGESRGIVNARVFVAEDEEPLAGTHSVAGRMADAGASELYVMPKQSDRQVLEDIYTDNEGSRWPMAGGWMTDAPLSTWYGVTADADDSVTELKFTGNNRMISGEFSASVQYRPLVWQPYRSLLQASPSRWMGSPGCTASALKTASS